MGRNVVCKELAWWPEYPESPPHKISNFWRSMQFPNFFAPHATNLPRQKGLTHSTSHPTVSPSRVHREPSFLSHGQTRWSVPRWSPMPISRIVKCSAEEMISLISSKSQEEFWHISNSTIWFWLISPPSNEIGCPSGREGNQLSTHNLILNGHLLK